MQQKNYFGQTIGYQFKDWTSRQKPMKIKLSGNYCTLEPLDIDRHSLQLFETFQLNNQGESWTYLPYGPFKTHQEFFNWLKIYDASEDPLFYAIIDLKTGHPVGLASYLRIVPEHGVIEVGHLHFSALLKRTAAATEAMYLMMKNVFDTLGYRRYEWKCNSLNQASRSAALRLGFQFEGVFRQSNIFKGYNRDTAWYSIIDSEWPALKIKFQKWFDPSNFDINGNQFSRLQEI